MSRSPATCPQPRVAPPREAFPPRKERRESGTRRGVLVTADYRADGAVVVTATWHGKSHGVDIPAGCPDPLDYAAAVVRGIAAVGVDGRKGAVPLYSSCS